MKNLMVAAPLLTYLALVMHTTEYHITHFSYRNCYQGLGGKITSEDTYTIETILWSTIIC
jgi:hypothetical protein